MRLVVGFLVAAPFALSIIIGLTVAKSGRQDFELIRLAPSGGDICEEHVPEDNALWRKRRIAIETSWEYESQRVLRSQQYRCSQALLFGGLATFALTCSVLVVPWGPWANPELIACTVAAAAATAYLFNLVRIALRISGGDATNRTFAWATRSLILVVIAAIGLYVLSRDAGMISSAESALLLGVFVGATGDAAILFLLKKGGASFAMSKDESARPRSPLSDIEGITDDHVERLKEEEILSVHDLAFVPTARLFFATAYSLQQICNWQDRALLLVYVGKEAAKDLAEKMQIRGAIDLRAFVHYIRFAKAGEDQQVAAQIKKTLGDVLKLDEGGLAALIRSMMHDEVAMRLRYYWGSVVGPAATRRLCGAITDIDGKPVANAAVTVAGEGAAATTAADGTFELAAAPVTDLTLVVTAEGFTAREIAVAGARTELELQLTVVRPAPPAQRSGAVTVLGEIGWLSEDGIILGLPGRDGRRDGH